jgi:hypothetical protein
MSPIAVASSVVMLPALASAPMTTAEEAEGHDHAAAIRAGHGGVAFMARTNLPSTALT